MTVSGSSAKPSLGGVLPVFQTPFTKQEEVDLDSLHSELRWMAGQGADGFVFGMVSEMLRLSDRERGEVAGVACSAGSTYGLPTVISVGAESTFGARDNAVRAEQYGAAAVMAIPPVAVSLSDAAVRGYYEGILQATTLPLIVQDASGYVGRSLSIETQRQLLAAYGDRVFFKPEAQPLGPRLSALRDATQGNARVFEGSGGIALIDSYRRGIVGTMPGGDLCWAAACIWRLLRVGDFGAAYHVSAPLISLIALQSSLDAFVVIEKYLLHKQGVLNVTDARGPLSFQLDDDTRGEVDRLFDELRKRVDQCRVPSAPLPSMENRGAPAGRLPHTEDSRGPA
jgi:dihydrodipicolinate synthase/N-acetylneuraminate lyase